MEKVNNYTYLDSYNIFNITTENDVEFDIGVFAESLILNDKIIVNANSPKNTLEKLIKLCGQDILIELIKEDIVSFVYDFIPFRLRELKEAENKICTLELDNYNTSVEQLFEESIKQIEVNEKSKRKLNQVVLDNLNITGFKKIDRKQLNSFIIKNINQNEVTYQILKANKPYHLFLDYWKNLEYKIEMVGNSLHLTLLELEYHDIKYIANIFGSAFLLPIVRAYITIISAEENNCISLWGNKSTEALFEANYNVLFPKKESGHFQTLITIENVSDVRKMVISKEMSIKKVMKIRNKSEELRKFIYNTRNKEEIEMIAEYFRKINKEERIFNNYAVKTIRFLVGYINPLLAAVDTFILPIVKDKVIKTVRIRDILK